MTRRRDVGPALAETLQAKAAALTLDVPPFDPHRTPLMPQDVAERSGGSSDDSSDDAAAPDDERRVRGSRRLLLRAAVVAAVALVGGAVAVRLGDGDGDGRTTTEQATTTTTTTTRIDDREPPAPDGLLLPTWLPDGMDLWDVEWSTFANPGLAGQTYQLFGDPGAGRWLLVSLVPDPHGRPDPSATQITVRGTSGQVGPDPELAGEATVVDWTENGALMRASFRGMQAAEAIAALDALTWRSTDYEDGLAAPAGGALPLQGEAMPGSAGATHVAELGYGTGDLSVVDDAAVAVSTATAPVPGGMSRDYLEDWFYGDRHDDGTTQRFDPVRRTLSRSWPDGRTVDIEDVGSSMDEASLERLARSIRPGTPGDAYRLRAEADANVASLPVLASTNGSRATLEVHGSEDGASGYRLCIRGTSSVDADPDCGVRGSFLEMIGTPDVAAVSVLIDGVWHVGVASATGAPQVEPAQAPPGQEPQPYPGERGRDGAWQFLLVEVPPGVDRVVVSPMLIGTNVERPR